MSTQSQQPIISSLTQVTAERQARARDPALRAAVDAVKAYQQRRFLHTYADLLESHRYSRAVRFFVDDLYGPMDFTRRDAEFARVVPTIVRLFPGELSRTVADLARLHALSEMLDTRMGGHASGRSGALSEADYVRAWRLTGRADDRQAQIELVLRLGKALDRLTRQVFLRHALRAMRQPARRAGFADLQAFLEEGFTAFHAMHGAAQFLEIVERREVDFARSMFGAPPAARPPEVEASM